MKVTVFGGTRFIGRATLEELAEQGHELMVVHRGETEPEGLPEARHVHVPRKEMASAAGEIADFAPDAVLDCLAMTRKGAEVALDVIPDSVTRRVMLSSIDVYRAYGGLLSGKLTDAVPFDETCPVRPERYPYRNMGSTDYEKLDAEELYLAAGGTILRLPMVYGEHDAQRREEFILRRVRAGRKRIPTGSGGFLGSRGYVRDVARAIRLSLETDKPVAGEVFNVNEVRTSPDGLWAQQILEAAGSDAELVRVPDDALPPDLGTLGAAGQHLLASPLKIMTTLGWEPGDPKENLRRSVAWHLDNPPGEPSDDFSADDAALEKAIPVPVPAP
ncbi:MAG TPA: NAD-dependent epimerase/dehydratase family protein [Actinomycetota bacterium]|nr:NAD-dependent epimerase/dehydratase family protein [Actinomycetota bacterium]